MNIPDSDLPTIRRALRKSYNWNRNNARGETPEMRAFYLRSAEAYKAVLDKLKKPRVNMNNCQQCGKLRLHGHEC